VRDRTICFLASEEEKDELDCLAGFIGCTRSSLVARIVLGSLRRARQDSEFRAWLASAADGSLDSEVAL